MKRLFLHIFFLLVISQSSYAQLNTVDSLESLLNKKKNSERAEVLLQISQAVVYEDPAKSLIYSTEAFNIGKKINNVEIKGRALYHIASSHWSRGELGIALDTLNSVLNFAVFNENGGLEARAYGGIGNVYSMAGESLSAIGFYKKSLEIFEKEDNEERVIAMNNNLGRAYLLIGKYDSAEYHLEIALDKLDEETSFMKPIIQFNKAELRFKQKNFIDAEALLVRSGSIAEEKQDKRGQIRSYQLLAEIELLNENKENALSLSEKAVKLAEKTNAKELLKYSYGTYAKVLGANGYFENGFKYFQLSNQYEDSLQSNKLVNRLKILEFEDTRKRIAYLKTERDLVSLSNERQRYLIYALSVVILLTAMIAWMYYAGRKKISLANRNLKQKNNEIEEQKAEIQKKATELNEINELKNKIISIITHDMKGPLINLHNTVELINIKAIDPNELQSIMPEIMEKVKSTNNLLNNLVIWAKGIIQGKQHDKSEIVLKELVKEEIDILSYEINRKQLQIENKLLSNLKLKVNKSLLSIIIRNLVSNAIKFSFNKGTISIETDDQKASTEFAIIIKDEGTGIARDKLNQLFKNADINEKGTDGEAGSGLGLILINDMVKLLKGRLSIESEENAGTTARIELPKNVIIS